MKRAISDGGDPATINDLKLKKLKAVAQSELPVSAEKAAAAAEEVPVVAENADSVLLDDNLLYEVLKHADARTLGSAACVSKQWHKTAQDERLWEIISTQHWAKTGCGEKQLRSVVLALGGFRRLHSLYLVPLLKPSSKPSSSSSTSSWPCLPPPPPPPLAPAKSAAPSKTQWGKDEVQLSLSLLSIRYFEKMNFSNRGK